MKSEVPKERSSIRDVAIIGMSCIFPGAPDTKAYWRNIVGKVDSVSEPPDDWGADIFYAPESNDSDRIYCKRGGYLHELASFDPLDYGVMPTSIDGGEPDHFLALRVAHEALADAGYRVDSTVQTRGDRVEVILGRGAYINRGFTNLVQHGLIVDQTLRLLAQLHPEHSGDELALLREELKSSLPPFNSEMAPGLVPNILSGRIANRLDLMGPNFTVDAACASSLIAVDRAMQDLLDDRCDLALTGGVHCSSPPPIFMVFCQLNALSRSGKIRPFAENADGTLLGEGLGMIVLKRTEDAERDGDRIYATIKSVGSASDGRALGLLTPRVEGEELAMRRAYAQGGISPSSIGLLEAHGTGTLVGDQTEAQAIARVFGARDGRPPTCALGSVKSMISHLIPAAGIAGIIKVALALHHKVLPPTLNCERPNPKLGLDATPLYINTETRPWIHGLPTPRRAGVNAFGFGGINAHAILEESLLKPPVPVPDGGLPWDSEVVILRGPSRAELVENCRRLESIVARMAVQNTSLSDLAYTVNCDVNADVEQDLCLAVVASSADDLSRKLSYSTARLLDATCTNVRDVSGIYFFERMLGREGKLAYLFPGEGSQYVNMLADLCLRLPPVREQFDLIDRAFSGHSRSWLPSQVIFPAPLPNDAETLLKQEKQLEQTDFAAEAVFAASQGLLALLRELEICPDMALGHSGGEISALLAAGAIRVDTDAELVCHIAEINKLYMRLLTDGLVPDGCAFAVTGVGRDVVIQTVQESRAHFDIGMDNCPHQVVVCGTGDSDVVLHRLRSIGAICTPLPYQRPYHTPAFERYSARVRPFFDRLKISSPRVPVYCGATATRFPDDPDKIRELAARQTSLPVRFRETVESMYRDGARIFVEVGPKGTLTSFVADTLRMCHFSAIASDLPRVPGVLQFNRLVAQLAAHGVPMRLNALYERRGTRRICLDEAVHSTAPTKCGRKLVTSLAHLRLNSGPRTSMQATHKQPLEAPVRPNPADASSPAPLPQVPESSHRNRQHTSAQRDAGHDRTSAMVAYLTSMDRFLAVQQEIMQAYLGRPRTLVPVPGSGLRPSISGDGNGVKLGDASAKLRSTDVASRNESASAPTNRLDARDLLPCTSNNGNGVKPSDANSSSTDLGSRHKPVNVLTKLLEVISERTGYPTDMLAPELNLEADLGIDSIKRTEILAALHRQTGRIGPDRMERVSSLKTISEIADYLNDDITSVEQLKLPLIGDLSAFEPRKKLVSVREFTMEKDLFLRDHALGGCRISNIDPKLPGLPVIPMTMTMEMIAEAAAVLRPGQKLIGLRNVRASQWLALDSSELRLRITAECHSADPTSEVQVEVRVDEANLAVAEGIAIFADEYPSPCAASPLLLRSARASEWTPERLYVDHMFHGPSFRGIASIDQSGEDGMLATLRSLPTAGLFHGEAAPKFLVDPILLDAAGQTVGYWAAERLPTKFNVFPYQIESVELYGSALPEGQPASCRTKICLVDDLKVHADLDVVDQNGNLLIRVRNWGDLRVEMPENFYRMCISPSGVNISVSRKLSSQTILCTIEMSTLPSFTAHGGIWLRALAHLVLNQREREIWRELRGPARRRIEWLLGRVCAKDAVRLLAEECGHVEVLPADVMIVADESGRPLVLDGPVRPAISISHADGLVVAAATLEQGTAIGVDVQRLDPSRDGFEDVALTKQERALLSGDGGTRFRENVLRFWCAKEAAAKVCGLGMPGGRPA